MLWCVLKQLQTINWTNDDQDHYDGLVQDCSNSIANALELLQSGTKPSVMCYLYHHINHYVLWQTTESSLDQEAQKPSGLITGQGK